MSYDLLTDLVRSLTCAAVLFASFFGETAPAQARERSLAEAIHVRTGASCIDGLSLREQIRSWLDADTVESDLLVEVEGDENDARRVSIRIWRGGRLIAQRRFAPGPSNCAEMDAVVGLSIALALKVSLRDELLDEAITSAPDGWSVGVAGTAAWNIVPGASGGARIWIEKILPEYMSVYFGLSGSIGGAHAFDRVSGEFMASSVAAEAAACAAPRLGKALRGRICAGLEARALFAAGSGFATSKDAVIDWFSVTNSVGISAPLGPRWSLAASVGLVAPLQRAQIAVVDPGGHVVETREVAPVGGLLSVGGAYGF